MKAFKISLFLAFTLAVITVKGQQQFLITQYMFNGLALNPAYAGVHEGLSVSALTRHQWVGMEGAPNTQFVSIHSPISYRPIALGAVIYRDEIGITREHAGLFSYAYRIQVAEKVKLSFGLQANIRQITQNFSANAADDLDDPLLQVDNSVKFNMGSGLLLHSDKFYVGFSIPQMLNNKFGSQNLETHSELKRHYYLSGGVIFPVSRNLLLKPNVLFKAVAGVPVQADVNLNALIHEVVWVGVSHRWQDSYSGLLAFQLTPQLQLGYAMDFGNKDLNRTSHELMLNYIVSLPSNKILTPRYF